MIAMKRYSLNVTKEVYLALMDLRMRELAKTGHSPTIDEVLRKQLHIDQDNTQKKDKSS